MMVYYNERLTLYTMNKLIKTLELDLQFDLDYENMLVLMTNGNALRDDLLIIVINRRVCTKKYRVR